MALTTAQATRFLADVHYSVALHTLRETVQSKRLLFVTVSSFLGLYILAAYALVSQGLSFVYGLPLLGPLLTERLIYLLFFFFFVMLVISNATITGMGLFRRSETSWLLSLPVPHKSLVLWKTLEGMVLASWALLLLSAPILVAIGQLYHVGASFYLATLPALLCLVLLASNFSAWLLLLLMRGLRRQWIKPIAIVAVIGLAVSSVQLLPDRSPDGKRTDVAMNVAQILNHTEFFTHPLLPSAWVAESALGAVRGGSDRSWFFNLTLLSWALASLVVTTRIAGWLFYRAWTQSLQPAPLAKMKAAAAGSSGRAARDRRWLVDPITQALMVKDMRTFIREPAQWGQTVLVFGLLFLYTGNLRRIVSDYQDPFWSNVISYLNLLVCSLSLSTLTTRFIYPQLSQEGQRLWLLGLSPVSMARVLRTKLWLTTVVTGTLTTLLTAVSCVSLELPFERAVFFIAAIVMLTVGLNALAHGLGTIFPDFREANPAKIVSGFGGTLCLITSFLFILASVAIALLPALSELHVRLPWVDHYPRAYLKLLSLAGIFVLTVVFGLIPYRLAEKRIKNLDYFTKA